MADDTPAHWSAALPDPIKAHITNRGLDKEDAPTAAAKLAGDHYAAQRLIGVPPEQILRLPKDAADPAYAEAYKRVASLGAYKEAAGYTFPEGTSESIAKSASETALKLGLPSHIAAELAAHMSAKTAEDSARSEAERTTALGAQQATLRANWGANYDLNLFKTTKVVEALGWDKATLDSMQTTVGGDKLMAALLGLAGKMSEAEILRGGGIPTGPSLNRDQALARKAEIMADAGTRTFTPVEFAAAQKELQQLAAIIVGPPR